MALAMCSRFESAAISPVVDHCISASEDPRQYVPSPFNSSVLDDFSAASLSNLSTFGRKDYSAIRTLEAKSYQEIYTTTNHFSDFENQYTWQWTNRGLPQIPDFSGYMREFSSKSSKIWRPFSPSPSRPNEIQTVETSTSTERRKRIKNCYNILHSITPSRVKIEPSKSSVFKPFKKKSYSCNHCPMTYLNSVQLISHMRVHTGSKPYSCEYPNCFKTFARNEELTRHRRIHSGYKPHLCTVCGKTFGRKDHLSKHLKTHLQVSEKKIYICCMPGCGHRYTRSDALTRHKSTAHSIDKAKPRVGNNRKEKDRLSEL